jgi:hypothetical protein
MRSSKLRGTLIGGIETLPSSARNAIPNRKDLVASKDEGARFLWSFFRVGAAGDGRMDVFDGLDFPEVRALVYLLFRAVTGSRGNHSSSSSPQKIEG